MSELSRDDQFFLDVLKRVLRDVSKGVNTLSAPERTLYYVNNFSYEYDNGGLSQFFYNCDCEASFLKATESALVEVGAVKTAGILRSAASLFTSPPDGTLGSTWGQYLKAVDPKGRLQDLDQQLPVEDEELDELLEQFVLNNRHELQEPKS
jgi:hypothetical protein